MPKFKSKLSAAEKKYYAISTLALAALAPVLNFYVEYGNRLWKIDDTLAFLTEHTILFVYGSVILFLILVLLQAALSSALLSAAILSSVAILLSFANMNKMLERSEPLFPIDLTMISVLGDIDDMVDQSQVIRQYGAVAIILAAGVLLSILLWRLKKMPGMRKHLLRRGITIVVSAVLLVAIASPVTFYRSDVEALDYDYIGWNQEDYYNRNGFTVSFTGNFQKIKMAEPEGYSREKIAEIVEKYTQVAALENQDRADLHDEDVNIVYVMNESFSDPERFADIYPTNADDLIPNAHAVMARTSSGELYSSVYGGGTAQMEFEALTGFSNYFPGIFLPFHFYVLHDKEFPSIARTLGDEFGYIAKGIHPYTPGAYDRSSSYLNMGFDSFYGEPDFVHTERISKYISDKSAYAELMQLLGEEDQKQFITLITMQNHMPYGYQFTNRRFKSFANTDSFMNRKISDYLELLHTSDEALGDLIDELDRFEEKTVLVFWGDHLPGVYEKLALDQDARYETPMFIYSNFIERDDALGSASANYIPSKLFDYLDVKKPAFYYLLDEAERRYPHLTRNALNPPEEVERAAVSVGSTGSAVSGAAVFGRTVLGHAVSGSAVSGQTVFGRTVLGHAVSGSAVSASVVSGAVVSGAAVSSPVVSGSMVSGSAVSGAAGWDSPQEAVQQILPYDFADYELIQYDVMSGKKYSIGMGFFDQTP
ncbi:MAG: sulfatase-like hydrolase/transferase [Clostridiales Family XIII bacterium]|jgi:phosphoglycerol transferase MdoB-like AlkP superfamily enzyme|nr:sulfatase-like hydrolase/transferase [Clostridiales Family XIII bacterium]